jgi:hypothetical protein
MKYAKVVLIMLLAFIPVLSNAQQQPSSHKHKTKQHVIKTTVEPTWAKEHNYDGTSHVYFPDYRSFYDPQRGGYVFWENDQWTFTPAAPPYMSSVDLGKERIQILKGLSLDLHPQLDYPRYMELYPAVHDYDGVPTPLPIAGNQ